MSLKKMKTKNKIPKNPKVGLKGKEYFLEVDAPAKTDTKEVADVGGPELSELLSWYQAAYDASRKERWQWFVIDQFLRGNQAVKGNAEDNSIEIVKRSNSINFPVNKIFSIFRTVRGYVTKHKPAIEVEPENSSEDAKKYARRANALLRRDNQLNNYRRINKEWVYYGIKYGIGYRLLGWDEEAHTTIRYSIDPFDILRGDKFGEIEDSPYVIRTTRRTIGYVRNKFGDVALDVAPDNELADDEYKKLSLEIAYNNQDTQTANIENQTVILKECWYKVDDKNAQGGTINKVIFTQSKKIHYEETPFNEYPIIPYKSDIVPNEANGEGHLKHLISPQRMLNLLNTQLLEYNHIVNHGRFLKDKDAGFRVINAKEGQIIEKKKNARVEVLNPPALNPALITQLQMVDDYMETLGGQHDASTGAAPDRVSSGAAIEALQIGDSNNIVDLRDNFEDSLALEATWILKLYSIYESEGVPLSDKYKDQDEQFIAMGQQALETMGKEKKEKKYVNFEDNGDYLDVLNILPDNHVKVSVYSQLGETKQERLNLLFKLLDAGIPLKFVLEYLEFPNTTDIFERVAEEALGEIALQSIGSGATQPPQDPNMPPAGPSTPPPAPAQPGPSPELASMIAGLKQRAGK